jgi:hypothetical protein
MRQARAARELVAHARHRRRAQASSVLSSHLGAGCVKRGIAKTNALANQWAIVVQLPAP